MSDYWSLDIPGLEYDQAIRLRDALQSEVPAGVVLVDPAIFMVRGFDLPAVALLSKCLEAGLATLKLSDLDRAGAQSMLEDCEDWLGGGAQHDVFTVADATCSR
ncbi:hypothetical protein [Knoellia sinensis]|nr:hypothetical protein [Knoellia sinensis]